MVITRRTSKIIPVPTKAYKILWSEKNGNIKLDNDI